MLNVGFVESRYDSSVHFVAETALQIRRMYVCVCLLHVGVRCALHFVDLKKPFEGPRTSPYEQRAATERPLVLMRRKGEILLIRPSLSALKRGKQQRMIGDIPTNGIFRLGILNALVVFRL